MTSHAGLALIGALLGLMELGARIDAVTLSGCREPKIPHSNIVKSMIGLLYMGKPDYDAIVLEGAFDRIVKEESAGLIHKTAPRH